MTCTSSLPDTGSSEANRLYVIHAGEAAFPYIGVSMPSAAEPARGLEAPFRLVGSQKGNADAILMVVAF